MIRAEKISKSFDGKKVLSDFTKTFPDNGIVCISGPSGCGKTTMLNILLGLVKQDSGKVILSKGLKLSAVFQEDRLFEEMTAAKNIEVVLTGSKDEKKAQAVKWLKAVELGECADKKPKELSGGMRRRVAIARALAYDAGAVLMDEPFKGLDDELKMRIFETVKQQAESRLFIIVTHDKREAELLGAESMEMTNAEND